MITEAVNSEFAHKISKSEYESRARAHAELTRVLKGGGASDAAIAQILKSGGGQPIDPADVYVSPQLTSLSVGFMMDANTVSARMCPSVQVAKQTGKFPTFPRSYWFRDEMVERADAQPAAEGTLAMTFDSYSAPVYAWRVPLGAQARANASPVDLDQAGTRICTNKAILKREKLWFSKFFTTGVWTTQLQLKKSGSGGVAGTDLSFADANAQPIKQIKKQIDAQSALVGPMYRVNKAVFSADVWTAFCEHPNVITRINAGQTPGGPAEATERMVAGWLGLEEVIVARAIETTSGESAASDTFARIATDGQILLAFVPNAPALFQPAAMYSFDWVPANSLVGGFGNAVTGYYVQERKAQIYEIEMATDPHKVSADCGILLYNCLDA